MMRDLEAMLRARKFPSQFMYGPERITRTGFFDHVIVFERARNKASDQVGPVKGFDNNPRRMRVRELCVTIRVYARSRLDGARVNEHEKECEQIVDALVIALAEWGTAAKAGEIPITEARYLTAEEYTDPDKPAEAWAGVVYSIQLRVPRGVTARDYVGAARPTGEAAGVGGSVEVRRMPGDLPEVVDLP
jgi:hypothetical protein